MKQPQGSRRLLVRPLGERPRGSGQGSRGRRTAKKDIPEPAVSALVLAARAGHLDEPEAWCLCCPQLGTRQRQKAKMHGASCSGTGSEEIKTASEGESHKRQHDPEMVKFIPEREFPPAPPSEPWSSPGNFLLTSPVQAHISELRNLETALFPPILKWELTPSFVYHSSLPTHH